MKNLVISGINLFSGGPLSIYMDCMDTIKKKELYKEYNITILVHRKELFKKYEDIVKIIELPKSRKNYLYRIFYEYFYFKKLFKNIHIDIWLSLHDMTPRVEADKIYTYCHNPAPFMDKDLRKTKNIKDFIFLNFYKYIYKINIKKTTIIVQQDWIRQEFKKMYSIKNVIVARPLVNNGLKLEDSSLQNDKKIFVYPAYPRNFKNFEQICEACKVVNNKNFEVWFSIDENLNDYSKFLYNKYKDIENIKWLGIQKREEILKWYEKSNCLIFPSKIETWGLPISEYKITGKDIILIDLPYAYETLGEYNKVMFFKNNDIQGLAKCIESVINNVQQYCPQNNKDIDSPYANNWDELLDIIMDKN